MTTEQEKEYVLTQALHGLSDQLGIHEGRLQTVERQLSAAPGRDTEIINLILRLDSMVSASLEERANFVAKIADLQHEVALRDSKIEELNNLLDQAGIVIRQQQNDMAKQPGQPLTPPQVASKKDDKKKRD